MLISGVVFFCLHFPLIPFYCFFHFHFLKLTFSLFLSFTLFRDRLPAMMVPRDEVGLWSILKHCMGKDLSKITIPVVFNEPLSFLQRMAEIFEYCNYLNIADQCDDVVERMEVSERLKTAEKAEVI